MKLVVRVTVTATTCVNGDMGPSRLNPGLAPGVETNFNLKHGALSTVRQLVSRAVPRPNARRVDHSSLCPTDRRGSTVRANAGMYLTSPH